MAADRGEKGEMGDVLFHTTCHVERIGGGATRNKITCPPDTEIVRVHPSHGGCS